jgi:hypothetical protein
MKFNRKYGEPMLNSLVKTRGWCKLKYRPDMFSHFGEYSSPELDWIEEHCVKDAQYCDGYFYFQDPAEATAFALVWTR